MLLLLNSGNLYLLRIDQDDYSIELELEIPYKITIFRQCEYTHRIAICSETHIRIYDMSAILNSVYADYQTIQEHLTYTNEIPQDFNIVQIEFYYWNLDYYPLLLSSDGCIYFTGDNKFHAFTGDTNIIGMSRTSPVKIFLLTSDNSITYFMSNNSLLSVDIDSNHAVNLAQGCINPILYDDHSVRFYEMDVSSKVSQCDFEMKAIVRTEKLIKNVHIVSHFYWYILYVLYSDNTLEQRSISRSPYTTNNNNIIMSISDVKDFYVSSSDLSFLVLLTLTNSVHIMSSHSILKGPDGYVCRIENSVKPVNTKSARK